MIWRPGSVILNKVQKLGKYDFRKGLQMQILFRQAISLYEKDLATRRFRHFVKVHSSPCDF